MRTAPSKKPNRLKTASSRSYTFGGIAALTFAVLVYGEIVWADKEDRAGYRNSEPSLDVTVSVQDGGVMLLGNQNAATTIDLFEDPMCSACATFHQRNERSLTTLVNKGGLAIRHHLLNFLDESSISGDYSTRAGAALLCVAQSGDAITYSALHTQLLTAGTQPRKGSRDLSNNALASIARESGSSDATAACILSGSNMVAAKTNAEAAYRTLKNFGSNSTPTVVSNNRIVNISLTDWVSEFES